MFCSMESICRYSDFFNLFLILDLLYKFTFLSIGKELGSFVFFRVWFVSMLKKQMCLIVGGHMLVGNVSAISGGFGDSQSDMIIAC